MNRAVIYYFWGSRYLEEAIHSAGYVREFLPYPRVVITDETTASLIGKDAPFEQVVTVERPPEGSLLAKARLYEALPVEYDSFVFLDTDTTVIGDITFGFEMAEHYGIAACMAPHYSLDNFWGFGRIMKALGVPRVSQLQYNTGVLFFVRRPEVEQVMRRWAELALTVGPQTGYKSDQPFFTLALESLRFNPYTLSPAYNYRDHGELASGIVRIWHSRSPVPQDVNEIHGAWPLRRFREGQRLAS
jgi:hypothetical protein